LPTYPDNELVLRLLADDVEAFDALYNRHSQALYANILKLTRDTEIAQDILQDVFVVLWEKRSTIDVNQPVSNWLFAISYYKSLKYLKTTLKDQLLRKTIKNNGFVPDNQNDEPEEHNMEVIRKAIQQLSPQKQKVLIRCKLAGKSYKEVANELNISKHTVKEYLSLAITSLRAILK
jgi:RNA polymerase sigma-70 factor (ECF subfamily)